MASVSEKTPSAIAADTAAVARPRRDSRHALKLSGRAHSRPVMNSPPTRSDRPSASFTRREASTATSAPARGLSAGAATSVSIPPLVRSSRDGITMPTDRGLAFSYPGSG